LADGCPSGTPERQAASRGIHIRSNADAKRNADLRMLIADLKLLDEFNQHSAFNNQQSAIENQHFFDGGAGRSFDSPCSQAGNLGGAVAPAEHRSGKPGR
jgi:hypothetical protein